MNILLASSSKYRQQLLQRLGIPFTAEKPDTDEQALANEAASELVLRLSLAKAQSLSPSHPGALIIGSDQVAALGSQILGKPGTHDAAVKQLQAASAKTLIFYTGLCLLNASSGEYQVDVVLTPVRFRSLTDKEIERYLQSEQPYDCAGSFKSEGLGITLFESIGGDDPSALMGLPLIRLAAMLRESGLALP